MPTRSQICSSASAKLAAADVKKLNAVVGLDGFVDSIIEVVNKRHSADSYDRMKTIAEFGSRVSAAAGQSSNYEFVITIQKLGGNGPIMANALASIGLGVSYVGNLGHPTPHPAFADMAKHAVIHSIAEPGHTDAVEFLDGKLMFGKHSTLGQVTWENILARVGLEKLTAMFSEADLIGLVNWTMLPHMTHIWQRLLSDVLPKLPRKTKPRTLFIDLADPEKRTADDLRTALHTLTKFQDYLEVILGLNLKESDQVAAVLSIPVPTDSQSAMESTAAQIRQQLNIGTVVIHPRSSAAAANRLQTARFAGPFVQHPKISTGAGDHFNAGFVTAQLLGLDLAESLCAGKATSGYYVRHAQSPTIQQLSDFISHLPPPEP
jgi:hypothetical protein